MLDNLIINEDLIWKLKEKSLSLEEFYILYVKYRGYG
jgi:hypothetical protein